NILASGDVQYGRVGDSRDSILGVVVINEQSPVDLGSVVESDEVCALHSGLNTVVDLNHCWLIVDYHDSLVYFGDRL
ncbi:hypothetical protein KR044_011839, partial [Drosophila immigrans]